MIRKRVLVFLSFLQITKENRRGVQDKSSLLYLFRKINTLPPQHNSPPQPQSAFTHQMIKWLVFACTVYLSCTAQPTLSFVNVPLSRSFVSVPLWCTIIFPHALKNCMFCEQFCGSAFISIRIRVWDRHFKSSGSGSRDLMTKSCKILQLKLINFLIKIWNTLYLSLGLHEGCPHYRRRLQPQKRTSSTSKQYLFPFCFKWANFAYLDPDPDRADQINSESKYSESTTLKFEK